MLKMIQMNHSLFFLEDKVWLLENDARQFKKVMKSEELSFRVKKDFTKQNVKVPLPKRFPKNKK